ncbi:MAG: hypothetical protein AAFY46_00760, partial [Planctomycetota bacterium]
MNSRTSRSLRTALSLLFASGTIAGCASPFHISTSDFAATPDERIRAIPPLDIEQYRVDESPAAPDASYVSRLTTGE